MLATKTSRTNSWSEILYDEVREHSLYWRKLVTGGGRAIASLFPSSRWAARGMLRGIDFKTAGRLVELGAGTGPVTAELLSPCNETCRCLIVEQDADFCELLRQRFPQAEIVEGDALAVDVLLNERGLATVDHLLSELPLGWVSADSRESFLQAVCRRLAPGGSFRQLTHQPGIDRPLFRQFFGKVTMQIIPWNLPPAAIYCCEFPFRGEQSVRSP